MRKLLAAVAVFGLLLAACATNNTTTAGSAPPAANSCDKANLNLLTPGTLTIAADNPSFPPWFTGKPPQGSSWKIADPTTGKGYEDEFAYDVAHTLGFTPDEVTWVPVNFNESYKPGPKAFDFYIGQVSYSPERAKAVDFSDNYYNVQQALIAVKGTPIANAKTFADLQGYKLGAQIGTTSYTYTVDNIKPSEKPNVYDNSNDVIAALNAGQIDGFLTDLPDAYVEAYVLNEVKDGVVVGQFPTIGDQERFGLVFEKGNPLVPCVDRAIATLSSGGMLDSLHAKYLKDYDSVPQITA